MSAFLSVKHEMNETQAAAHQASLNAGILPTEKWRRVFGFGEEDDESGDKNWWLGKMVGKEPDGIGYFVFRRHFCVKRGGDEFGHWVFGVRYTECTAGKPGLWNGWQDIAVEGDEEKAKAVALAHRSSPLGWVRPEGAKWVEVWEESECHVWDKTYWLGHLSPENRPIGAGWYIRKSVMDDYKKPPFFVYWMCGQDDWPIRYRKKPLEACKTMMEAERFAENFSDLVPYGYGVDEWDLRRWAQRDGPK